MASKQEGTPIVYAQSTNATESNHTVTVHAVPVSSTPAVVYATPDPAAHMPMVHETEEMGICRKCRRMFRRPPGVNDGQAQYYRCKECDDERGLDLLYSCTIA